MANRAPSIWVRWACLQYVGCSLLCALTGAFLGSWECIALPFVCSTVMGACSLPHAFVKGASSFAPVYVPPSCLQRREGYTWHLHATILACLDRPTPALRMWVVWWPAPHAQSTLIATTTSPSANDCLTEQAAIRVEIETNIWLTLGPQQYTRVPFDIHTGRYSLDKPLTG